jgi:hypothetical protein
MCRDRRLRLLEKRRQVQERGEGCGVALQRFIRWRRREHGNATVGTIQKRIYSRLAPFRDVARRDVDVFEGRSETHAAWVMDRVRGSHGR